MHRLASVVVASSIVLSGCTAQSSSVDEPITTITESSAADAQELTGAEIEDAFLRLALATSATEKASIYSQYGLDRDGFFELVEDHFEPLAPYKWDLEEELWRTDQENAARFFAKFGLFVQLWEGDPAPERKLEGEIYKIDDGKDRNSKLLPGSVVILRYYTAASPEQIAAESSGEETRENGSKNGPSRTLSATDEGTVFRVEYSGLKRMNLTLFLSCRNSTLTITSDDPDTLRWRKCPGDDSDLFLLAAYEIGPIPEDFSGLSTLTTNFSLDCNPPNGDDWWSKLYTECGLGRSAIENRSRAPSATQTPTPSPTQTSTPTPTPAQSAPSATQTPTPSPTQTSTPTPTPAQSAPSYTYQALNSQVVAADGMSVTVTDLYLTPKSGSTQLTVAYSMTNNTSDKEIVEGSFALFFDDGSKLNQYGFFNNLFPGDSSNRRYVFEWTGSKKALLIEYEADFFASKPTQAGLKWKAPE